jgi:nucleoside-diphosphate-sugar epimerase
VFGLVRSSDSDGALVEMGADAVTGDALNAASVKAAIQQIRPDAIINELTSLPRHYTPEEMKAAADRDRAVRTKGNINLLAAMHEAGVRRYILQSSGFWYVPGAGLANEMVAFAVEASPGVAAGARTYVELESAAFRTPAIECVALRYGFFYGRVPGTQAPAIWASRCANSMSRSSARARACGVSSKSKMLRRRPRRRSDARRERTILWTMTRASSAYGCQHLLARAELPNRLKSRSSRRLPRPAPILSITRPGFEVRPMKKPNAS